MGRTKFVCVYAYYNRKIPCIQAMGESVKFYPELVLAAMRSNKPVGGVRLFCIAKHRDNGNGHLPIDDLKAYAKRYLGIPKARYNRWLREALRLRIVKRSGNVLTLSSWGKAAVAVGGIERLAGAVEMGVTQIADDGWAAWVWAAYMKRHEGKPITRATLERLTGVPERTQRHYEAEAGVENHANYGDFGLPENNPEEAITEEADGWFWNAGRIKKRLGNSRIVTGVEECKRGRTKKHNQVIAAASSLWGGSQHKQRLFFDGPHKAQALKKTLRAMRKDNQPYNTRPNVLFLHVGERLGVGFWAALPCD